MSYNIPGYEPFYGLHRPYSRKLPDIGYVLSKQKYTSNYYPLHIKESRTFHEGLKYVGPDYLNQTLDSNHFLGLENSYGSASEDPKNKFIFAEPKKIHIKYLTRKGAPSDFDSFGESRDSNVTYLDSFECETAATMPQLARHDSISASKQAFPKFQERNEPKLLEISTGQLHGNVKNEGTIRRPNKLYIDKSRVEDGFLTPIVPEILIHKPSRPNIWGTALNVKTAVQKEELNQKLRLLFLHILKPFFNTTVILSSIIFANEEDFTDNLIGDYIESLKTLPPLYNRFKPLCLDQYSEDIRDAITNESDSHELEEGELSEENAYIQQGHHRPSRANSSSSFTAKDSNLKPPKGYEFVDWNTKLVTPPMNTPLDIHYTNSLNEYKEIPVLSDSEIIDIIKREYKPFFLCPNSSIPNVETVILDTEHHCIYVYKLETFTESRSVEWAQEPWVEYGKKGSSDSLDDQSVKNESQDSKGKTKSNYVAEAEAKMAFVKKAPSLNFSLEFFRPKIPSFSEKGSRNYNYMKTSLDETNLPLIEQPPSSLNRRGGGGGDEIIDLRDSSSSSKLLHKANNSNMPPDAWAIPFETETYFSNMIRSIEIPDTASFSKCNGCKGDGWKRCWRCSGRGTVSCITCGGTGKIPPSSTSPSTNKKLPYKKHTITSNLTKDFCFSCSGRGRKRCQTCDIEGKLVCELCKGFKGVKSYVKLTIKFTNHESEYVHGAEEFPNNNIPMDEGAYVFEQNNVRVNPLDDFNEDEINEASHKLFEDHLHLSKYERILQQKHSIRALPYTNIKYKDNKRFKSKRDICIYGYNKRIIYLEENENQDYINNPCLGCILN